MRINDNEHKKMKLSSKIIVTVLFLSFLIPVIFTFASFMIPMLTVDVDIISEERFKNEMKKYNCEIVDILKEKKINEIDLYYVTDPKTCPFSVSYTIFNDDESKDDFYRKLLGEVFNNNGNINVTTNINLNNYYEYSTIGAHYKAVVMNKNSILYIDTLRSNKYEAVKMKKLLGYDNSLFLNFDMSIKSAVISFVILSIITLINWWKLNTKFGRKGWVCLIPVYNIACLTKDVFGSWIYCLMLLIPFANFVYMIMLFIKMANVFGKSDEYGLGLIFLNPLFASMLAFGEDDYINLEDKEPRSDLYNDESKNERFFSKFFWKLFLVPSIIWVLFSLLALIPDETDPDPLTCGDLIIADVTLIIMWLLISCLINFVVKQIKKIYLKSKEKVD